jgi:hypothetical protein
VYIHIWQTNGDTSLALSIAQLPVMLGRHVWIISRQFGVFSVMSWPLDLNSTVHFPIELPISLLYALQMVSTEYYGPRDDVKYLVDLVFHSLLNVQFSLMNFRFVFREGKKIDHTMYGKNVWIPWSPTVMLSIQIIQEWSCWFNILKCLCCWCQYFQ